ncbi:MAG: TIGR02757 family protein [Nitrospirae bacterium]|nr:TIGR02757 family protein [Nitrospirota bacterium]
MLIWTMTAVCKPCNSASSLKQVLDGFYDDYNFRERLKHDPIEFPHRHSDPGDIEIAGFIASCFAYGKVELFKPVIEKILGPGGRRPAEFVMNFNLKKDKKYFRGISYRFNKEEDVLCLIYILSRTLNEWGSLKNLFYHFYKPEHEDIRKALTGFVEYFHNTDTSAVYNPPLPPFVKGGRSRQFFSSPEGGSACKRMNLFLRWMVRTADIDFGIWNKVPPSKLIIPLDTHIARISRCLCLTKRKSSDWKTAKEITDSLKKIDPDDPLKYDFALCHHGISKMCMGGKFKDSCSSCALKNKLSAVSYQRSAKNDLRG